MLRSAAAADMISVCRSLLFFVYLSFVLRFPVTESELSKDKTVVQDGHLRLWDTRVSHSTSRVELGGAGFSVAWNSLAEDIIASGRWWFWQRPKEWDIFS